MHKKSLSDKEYSFYKNHIVPPPDSINENAYRTKSTSPFQSLAVVESEIRESLNRQKVEDSQYSSHFLARIWRDITRDYEGNVLSDVSRYFPVVTEIAFLYIL